jgi:hypothetical protein
MALKSAVLELVDLLELSIEKADLLRDAIKLDWAQTDLAEPQAPTSAKGRMDVFRARLGHKVALPPTPQGWGKEPPKDTPAPVAPAGPAVPIAEPPEPGAIEPPAAAPPGNPVIDEIRAMCWVLCGKKSGAVARGLKRAAELAKLPLVMLSAYIPEDLAALRKVLAAKCEEKNLDWKPHLPGAPDAVPENE